jgi:hypothetical protein
MAMMKRLKEQAAKPRWMQEDAGNDILNDLLPGRRQKKALEASGVPPPSGAPVEGGGDGGGGGGGDGAGVAVVGAFPAPSTAAPAASQAEAAARLLELEKQRKQRREEILAKRKETLLAARGGQQPQHSASTGAADGATESASPAHDDGANDGDGDGDGDGGGDGDGKGGRITIHPVPGASQLRQQRLAYYERLHRGMSGTATAAATAAAAAATTAAAASTASATPDGKSGDAKGGDAKAAGRGANARAAKPSRPVSAPRPDASGGDGPVRDSVSPIVSVKQSPIRRGASTSNLPAAGDAAPQQDGKKSSDGVDGFDDDEVERMLMAPRPGYRYPDDHPLGGREPSPCEGDDDDDAAGGSQRRGSNQEGVLPRVTSGSNWRQQALAATAAAYGAPPYVPRRRPARAAAAAPRERSLFSLHAELPSMPPVVRGVRSLLQRGAESSGALHDASSGGEGSDGDGASAHGGGDGDGSQRRARQRGRAHGEAAAPVAAVARDASPIRVPTMSKADRLDPMAIVKRYEMRAEMDRLRRVQAGRRYASVSDSEGEDEDDGAAAKQDTYAISKELLAVVTGGGAGRSGGGGGPAAVATSSVVSPVMVAQHAPPVVGRPAVAVAGGTSSPLPSLPSSLSPSAGAAVAAGRAGHSASTAALAAVTAAPQIIVPQRPSSAAVHTARTEYSDTFDSEGDEPSPAKSKSVVVQGGRSSAASSPRPASVPHSFDREKEKGAEVAPTTRSAAASVAVGAAGVSPQSMQRGGAVRPQWPVDVSTESGSPGAVDARRRDCQQAPQASTDSKAPRKDKAQGLLPAELLASLRESAKGDSVTQLRVALRSFTQAWANVGADVPEMPPRRRDKGKKGSRKRLGVGATHVHGTAADGHVAAASGGGGGGDADVEYDGGDGGDGGGRVQALEWAVDGGDEFVRGGGGGGGMGGRGGKPKASKLLQQARGKSWSDSRTGAGDGGARLPRMPVMADSDTVGAYASGAVVGDAHSLRRAYAVQG